MIKIYQINHERDKNHVKFMWYDWIKEFDFSIYDEVWSGEEPDGCDDLEGIFEVFNLHHPDDFRCNSLSVSDIVQIIGSDEESNGYYFCDMIGWRKLDAELIKR